MTSEEKIYAPPAAPTARTGQSGTTLSSFFAIAGVAVAILPVPIFLFTVYGILMNADQIVSEAQGDSSLVAGHISQALTPVVMFVAIGMAGFLTAICASGFGSYRARWFFWAMVLVAVIYLPVVPPGTLLAIACATVLYRKHSEFFPPAVADSDNRETPEDRL